MLKIRYEKSFKKDYTKVIKRGYDPKAFETVVEILANQYPMPKKYRDHSLIGNWNGFRECHIAPGWLLIYRINDDALELCLTRTGTHSDLFKK
ncbi:MAG: type II toxin-antitoxin system YafQ family toxin [Clostridia bacterium]|nr:type II toxin-antitoxin system YafQ family toxin [Clostridia bacterium]